MSKKRTAQDDDVTLASLLGSSSAIVQHGIDLAISGLMARLKDANNGPKSKSSNPVIRFAGGFIKGMVGFVGTAGDSYMHTYEDLKRERPKRS